MKERGRWGYERPVPLRPCRTGPPRSCGTGLPRSWRTAAAGAMDEPRQ